MGLQEMSRSYSSPADPSRVMGVTMSQIRYEAFSKGAVLINQDTGQACARPEIHLTIDAGEQVIAIAKELPRGTCGHNVVLNHELRHAITNQSLVENVATQAREALIAYFQNHVMYGTKSSIEREIMRILETEWFPWIKRKLALRDELHARIDTPIEYARVGNACDGEIARILTSQHSRR